MNTNTIRELTRDGIIAAEEAGFTKAALAKIAGWTATTPLYRFLENPQSQDMGNVQNLYRFLLQHRFIENPLADLTNKIYALGDVFASDVVIEEKFLKFSDFIRRYSRKEAIARSMQDEAGKGEV